MRSLKNKIKNGKNKITVISGWAIVIIRYGAGIIDWKQSELKSIGRKTRKDLNVSAV